MLRSDLCHYSDVYTVVKRDTVLTKAIGRSPIDMRNRFLAFKNNVPLTNCRRSRYCNANVQFA